MFCLLLTSSHTAIDIFIFGSCSRKPVRPCLFPCTLRPSNIPASGNAQTVPEGAWFCLTACAHLHVYYDMKIPPLNIPPSLASFPPVPLHHPRSTDRQTTGRPRNPPAHRGMGEGVQRKSRWGEQNSTGTNNLSSGRGAASCGCKMGQDLGISLPHCWVMQISRARSSCLQGYSAVLPTEQQKMTGQKSTV